jgi:hypothetical protein
MNDHTQLLDRYLQNELPEEEKAELENLLNNDAVLRQEMELQLKIINAIKRVVIKQQFAKALKKQRRLKKIFWWSFLVVILIGIGLIFHHIKNCYHHT